MSAPLVSCIIPVYNGEDYLAEAVESVLRQTYAALEPIVIDDGSSDGSAAVIATFGTRVRCLHQTNSGLAASRNRGIRAASGQFIAFLDADDVWLPDKIACQMERFRIRAETEVSVTYIENFWDPQQLAHGVAPPQHALGAMPGYASPTMVARRAVFDRVGLYADDLKTAACRDWFIRAREHHVVFDMLPRVLVRRRLHRANMSRQPAKVEDYARLVKRHLDRQRGRP